MNVRDTYIVKIIKHNIVKTIYSSYSSFYSSFGRTFTVVTCVKLLGSRRALTAVCNILSPAFLGTKVNSVVTDSSALTFVLLRL